MIKLILLPFKIMKLFMILSVEVVKFMLLLPFLLLGGTKR